MRFVNFNTILLTQNIKNKDILKYTILYNIHMQINNESIYLNFIIEIKAGSINNQYISNITISTLCF